MVDVARRDEDALRQTRAEVIGLMASGTVARASVRGADGAAASERLGDAA